MCSQAASDPEALRLTHVSYMVNRTQMTAMLFIQSQVSQFTFWLGFALLDQGTKSMVTCAADPGHITAASAAEPGPPEGASAADRQTDRPHRILHNRV